jgi:hypothetical protein
VIASTARTSWSGGSRADGPDEPDGSLVGSDTLSRLRESPDTARV